MLAEQATRQEGGQWLHRRSGKNTADLQRPDEHAGVGGSGGLVQSCSDTASNEGCGGSTQSTGALRTGSPQTIAIALFAAHASTSMGDAGLRCYSRCSINRPEPSFSA